MLTSLSSDDRESKYRATVRTATELWYETGACENLILCKICGTLINMWFKKNMCLRMYSH